MPAALDNVALYADAHVASRHTGAGDYEQRNPGAGVTVERGAFAVSGGAYRNSYARDSAYLLGTWMPWRAQLGALRVSAGASAGFVSGYARDELRTAPFVGTAVIVLDTARARATIRFVPPAGDSAGVATLTLSVRITP